MVPSRGQSFRQTIKIKIEKLYFRSKKTTSKNKSPTPPKNNLFTYCPLEGTTGVSRTTKNTAQKFVKIFEICV
jgi:hypothetical protein